jgi:hypothetical protein
MSKVNRSTQKEATNKSEPNPKNSSLVFIVTLYKGVSLTNNTCLYWAGKSLSGWTTPIVRDLISAVLVAGSIDLCFLLLL